MAERSTARMDSERVVAFESVCAEQTGKLGMFLGQIAVAGTVVTLAGPFGAGKTTFVQGLGKGLGIQTPIVSPSFALINEYLPLETGGRLGFFHFDLYRLEDIREVANLDLDDYMARQGVLAIEWPEIARMFLPRDHISIDIRPEDNIRHIQFSGVGAISARLLDSLESHCHSFEGTRARVQRV